jgi:hypothetical protein
MKNSFEQMQELMEETAKDATKAYAGNKSAITRTRLAMQKIKGLAQEVRGEVQAIAAGQ